MQAGESLSFIPVPEVLATPEVIPDDENIYATYHFYHFVQGMLTNPNYEVRSLVRPEEIGTVIAQEASFQLLFSDGSYLYLVAYGHEFQGDYLDIGFSITEHSDRGHYLGGFSYELSGADLRYSAHHAPTPPSDEFYEEDRTYHFSLLDQYAHKDELEHLKITGDEAVRLQAEHAYAEWQEEVDLALASKDLGLSWRQPSLEEVLQLKSLLSLASPFKIEQS